MKSLSIAVAALFAATTAMADPTTSSGSTATTATGVEEPSADPTLNAAVVQGCFSSAGMLKMDSTQTFNSKSKCALDICGAHGKFVAGTMGGNQCWCGDSYPPNSTRVSDSHCSIGCSGFNLQACGGNEYWTIYNTGVTLVVEYEPDPSSSSSVSSSSTSTSSSSTSTSSSSTSTTVPPTTTTSAAPVTSTAKSNSGGGNKNTVGIAVGVVVAVVAVAALIGVIFFLLRRRRNRELEEEQRRNAAVNAFIKSAKGPGSSDGFSIPDSRLDPVMAHRRVSNGSIADNEDYSRRILRVTNA